MTEVDDAVMDLLKERVPLSLLYDLWDGPHSAEIMAVERGDLAPAPVRERALVTV